MLDHLARYREIPEWSLGGTKERIAPFVLARLFKSGQMGTTEMKRFIASKEIDSCHSASELMLLAMVVDRMMMLNVDLVNSEAMEIVCRRIHGLKRAFEGVRRLSDGKQPKGPAGQKWKTKVKWELCDQYDIRALGEEGAYIPGADEEVRQRLEKTAIFNKYLTKARSDEQGPDGS